MSVSGPRRWPRRLRPGSSEQDRDFWNLYAEVACFGFMFGILQTFLNVYALRLGASNEVMGWLAAMPSLVFAVWAIPAAGLIERTRNRLRFILILVSIGGVLIAAAAGALAWMFASWYKGKPSSLGMVSGAIAGMVAITPAAGFVTPLVAVLIGAVAGVLCFEMMLVRIRRQLDESLDAWAIHGMGGLWGTVATGFFAAAAIGGFSGLIEGNSSQFVNEWS